MLHAEVIRKAEIISKAEYLDTNVKKTGVWTLLKGMTAINQMWIEQLKQQQRL
jgi:hypothetical protein